MRNTPTPLAAGLEPDIGGLLFVSSARKRVRSVPRLLGVPTLNDSGCTRTGRVGSVAKRRRVLTDSGPCPPLGPWNLYSRDGVMRGVLSPSSDKLGVGIVAQAGWSRWHAVADSLGWHTVCGWLSGIALLDKPGVTSSVLYQFITCQSPTFLLVLLMPPPLMWSF